MGGAQPLAVTMNDGVVVCVDVDPSRIERRVKTRYLDVSVDDVDEALRMAVDARDRREPLSIGVLGNAADVVPRLAASGAPIDIVTDQTSAHDPLSYIPQGLSLEEAAELRASDAAEYTKRAQASMAAHCAGMVAFLDGGAEVFDYGNNLRAEAEHGGFDRAFAYPGVHPGLHPAAVLRRQGPVPVGGAVGRSGRHRGDRPRGPGGVP